MSYKILTLNNIAIAGLKRFPRDQYEIASEIGHPDAIMLRSFKMHDMEIPDSVMAVGRAGVGVNNIPVDRLSARGIPVFNAPGANANAVKELVIGSLLLTARQLCPAWDYVRNLKGDDETISKAVEAGKKKFVGYELPHRRLGVIGLGAIGVEVANAALALGMEVVGFDPKMTVERAWQLSSGVEQAVSLDDLMSRCEFVSLHVPLVEATRNLIDSRRLGIAREGLVLLNFARGGIVDEEALEAAISAGRVRSYVTDFPSRRLKDHPQVIALPHLGASTAEAEENCAVMVADNLRAYLERGTIRNSVNFPMAVMPRGEGFRLTVANANVPNMVGQISTALAAADLNILDMLNKSRGDLAYTVVDVATAIPAETLAHIRSIEGVLAARAID